MTPGDSPFEQLAAALERVATAEVADVLGGLTVGGCPLSDVTVRRLVPTGGVVLVVVDQFEELFTGTIDADEQQAFLELLVAVTESSADAVRVVVTLRADYYDRPLARPASPRRCAAAPSRSATMTDTELAAAVRRPASDRRGGDRARGRASGSPPTRGAQPGALPLVQHALAELFDRRRTNTLTRADYLAAGGMREAIGRRAEALYDNLDDRPTRRRAPGVPRPRQRQRRPRGHPPTGPSQRTRTDTASDPTNSTRCSASSADTAC